jgi:hypothetical protein
MAIETVIRFGDGVTPRAALAALTSFARDRSALVSTDPRPSVELPQGFYLLSNESFYCRANKFFGDGFVVFDRDCLTLAAALIAEAPQAELTMLHLWEIPVLEKHGRLVIVRCRSAERLEGFIERVGEHATVEIVPERAARLELAPHPVIALLAVAEAAYWTVHAVQGWAKQMSARLLEPAPWLLALAASGPSEQLVVLRTTAREQRVPVPEDYATMLIGLVYRVHARDGPVECERLVRAVMEVAATHPGVKLDPPALHEPNDWARWLPFERRLAAMAERGLAGVATLDDPAKLLERWPDAFAG